MSGYAVAHLDEIDEIDDGRCPLRPVRHHFGITSFGVNAWTAREAGDRIINEHDESDDGLTRSSTSCSSGRARFELDGERVDAPAGTFVFVPAGVKRTAFAEEPGTTIVAVGGDPGEGVRAERLGALGAAAARSTRRASTPRRPIAARELVEAHPSTPALLYNLACCESLAGPDDRRDRASPARDRAVGALPRVREGRLGLRSDPRRARVQGARRGVEVVAHGDHAVWLELHLGPGRPLVGAAARRERRQPVLRPRRRGARQRRAGGARLRGVLSRRGLGLAGPRPAAGRLGARGLRLPQPRGGSGDRGRLGAAGAVAPQGAVPRRAVALRRDGGRSGGYRGARGRLPCRRRRAEERDGAVTMDEDGYFDERVAAQLRRVLGGDVRPGGRRPGRSTSSPSWPEAAGRWSSASGRAGSPCRSRPRRAGARHRPVAGDGRRGCARSRAARTIGVTIGDFATTTVDGHVLARLPRLQHDHEPDHAGGAGRLLPQRRRAPRARRLLRHRGRGPGAAAAAAGRDDARLPREPRRTGASTSTTSRPRARLAPLRARRRTLRAPSRSRSATSGRPSST